MPRKRVQPEAQDALQLLELETAPKKYGMRLDKLDEPLLHQICLIYDASVGGHASVPDFGPTLERVQGDLQRSKGSEWRVGSKISKHSKLWVFDASPVDKAITVPLIRFNFQANIDRETQKSILIKRNFDRRIRNFLLGAELAVEIE